MSKVMTVNSGSSSLKFKLYEMPEEKVICSGLAERIGEPEGGFTIKYNGVKESTTPVFKTHADAVRLLLDSLIQKGIIKSYDEIKSVGHRFVQGGTAYASSVVIDEKVVAKVEELIPLAPIHNPANLICYKAFKEVLPNVDGVAVFDTAFHQTMAPEDYVYPIPYELTEKYQIRRYGFHGTSHKFLAQESYRYLEGVKEPKVISCHIGSGASLAAIKNGKCVATSMGLSPLGGIMMGTRTGDMDPSVFSYVCQVTGKSMDEVYAMFNKKSGFLGVSGISNDSRDILNACKEGNERAILANEIFTRRIADYIGQYFVRLGGCDLLVFSAGIGENSAESREQICAKVAEALGIVIDNDLNYSARGKEAVISAPESKVKVVVIPTDEEVMIARDAYTLTIGGNK